MLSGRDGECVMTGQANSDVAESTSPFSFQATVDRLVAAIEGAGMTLFARIDHAANALQAGLSMPPAIVLIYGNAKGGTPIMLAAPRTALDLPLRVLVREDDGRTLVAFHRIGPILLQAGVPDLLAAKLDPAQQLLVAALRT
jgi:uncharacterized protein (DUF302 family)